MSETLEQTKKIALKHVELMAEEMLAAQYDQLVDKVTAALKDVIPGETFDVIVDVLKAQFAAKGREALAAQIEKISDEV